MSCPESAKVFLISDDDAVRTSRERLLQSAGYSVVSTRSDCVLDRGVPQGLDIAIVGHTVDNSIASRIADKFRRTQAYIRILRITEQFVRPGPGFDCVCFAEDGPRALLSCVAELAARGTEHKEEESTTTEMRKPIEPSEDASE